MNNECGSEVENDACAGCANKEPAGVTRRAFFASLLGVCSGTIAAVVGMPMLRYVLYPVQAATKSSKWTEVGDASEFEKLKVQ